MFDKDQVYDFKYRGFAHVQFFRTDEYYEAFQILTDEEYKDSKFYTEDEIYQMYAMRKITIGRNFVLQVASRLIK